MDVKLEFDDERHNFQRENYTTYDIQKCISSFRT